jgi:hypothetical protein
MNAVATARLAHSAAQRERNSFPMGSRPDLDAAVEAAYEQVKAALAAQKIAPVKVQHVVARPMYRTCCEHAVEVRNTVYAFETNCHVHGNRTRGTAD